MSHQEKFYEACKNGNLTVITNLLNNYNINVNANNEYGI